jgi:ribonuclease P protein component
MTKLWRRLSSKEFQQLFHEGSFLSGKLLCINVKKQDGPAVGFTLKKKKRDAVLRNFMRRRLREAFLKVQEFIPSQWQIVIIGLDEVKTTPIDELSAELYRLVQLGARKWKQENENPTSSY